MSILIFMKAGSGSCFPLRMDPDPGQLHPGPQPCPALTLNIFDFEATYKLVEKKPE